MTKFIIAGDIFPVKANTDLFRKGDIKAIIGEELEEVLQTADIRIANLEGPFTLCNNPINKSGPALKAEPSCMYGIKKMGIDIVSLANNHILDYGEEGYLSTINLLEEYKISYVGAGKNILQARKPLIREINGIKLGIYSCAEYEFTIATRTMSGANNFDPLYTLDAIESLRREVDYLIVLYHGMKELYRYPAPYVMERCRIMVDKGADLVLCQHSHCIGCYEEYNNGTILYGQGDFCFCSDDLDERKTGLLVEVVLPGKKINFIPVQKENNVIRKAVKDEKQILEDFYNRSKEIQDNNFVERNYDNYAKEIFTSYLMQSLGRVGGWLVRFNKKHYVKKLYRNYHYLDLLNCLRCEAHNDIFIRGLMSEIREFEQGKNKNKRRQG